MKSGKWAADFTNDPSQDYALICEVLHDEKDIAVIRKKNDVLTITWYEARNDVDVPLDWFLELLQEAKTRIS